MAHACDVCAVLASGAVSLSQGLIALWKARPTPSSSSSPPQRPRPAPFCTQLHHDKLQISSQCISTLMWSFQTLHFLVKNVMTAAGPGAFATLRLSVRRRPPPGVLGTSSRAAPPSTLPRLWHGASAWPAFSFSIAGEVELCCFVPGYIIPLLPVVFSPFCLSWESYPFTICVVLFSFLPISLK